MHLSSWASFAFTGLTMASPGVNKVFEHHRRSFQDAPAARSGIATVITAIADFDGSLKQVTAENVATSLKDLNQKSHALGTALESAAKTISASGPLKGVQDAIGLMTPGQKLMAVFNTTSLDLALKFVIIKNSKQGDLVVDGLKAIKTGVIPFQNALNSQIPINWRGSISVAPAGIELTDKQISDILDDLIKQTGAIIDSKAASYTIPASFPIPSGLAGLLGAGLPGAAEGLPAAIPGLAPAPTVAPANPAGSQRGSNSPHRLGVVANESPERRYISEVFKA